jgi:hypothetical protein
MKNHGSQKMEVKNVKKIKDFEAFIEKLKTITSYTLTLRSPIYIKLIHLK